MDYAFPILCSFIYFLHNSKLETSLLHGSWFAIASSFIRASFYIAAVNRYPLDRKLSTIVHMQLGYGARYDVCKYVHKCILNVVECKLSQLFHVVSNIRGFFILLTEWDQIPLWPWGYRVCSHLHAHTKPKYFSVSFIIRIGYKSLNSVRIFLYLRFQRW